jgi:CheY-like chemotaxis protein
MSVAPEKKAAGPLTDDLTGQGRILLVDDEEMVREAAQNLLKHLGYDVYTCSDGAEAVGFYSEHQNEIDLVIMDMIMPVMNGMDAFIKLKKINPKVKVLISSGFSAGRESNELFKLGLKGYLGKPYHLADLAAKIKKVIKES